MFKYLVSLCAVFVLVGCSSGGPDNVNIDPAGNDATGVTQDRWGWDGGIPTVSDTSVEVEEDAADIDVADEPRTSPVKLTGTINSSVYAGATLNSQLTASGGSGSYEWTAIDFPDWLRLEPTLINGNKAKVRGTVAGSGRTRFKVQVCDLEDGDNCKKRTFTVSIKTMEIYRPMVSLAGAFTSTGSGSTCSGAKPVITEQVSRGRRVLSETELNIGILGQSIDEKKFKVAGGKGPYTWDIATEVEDDVFYCAYHDCGDGNFMPSEWRDSEAEDDDTGIFHLEGSFQNGVHYCNGAYAGNSIACDGEDSLHDTIRVKVTDSCGASDENSYPFVINSPSETIEDLYIETRAWGDDMWDWGSYVVFKLYDHEDTLIAESETFRPGEGDAATWRIKLFPKSGYRDISIDRVGKLKVWMHDDAGCGGLFDMTLDYIFLLTRYHYVARDENWWNEVNYELDCASDAAEDTYDVFSEIEWLQWSQPITEFPTIAAQKIAD